MTRREAVLRVTTLLGGIALVGGDRLLAASASADARSRATALGAGEFTSAEVAFLDEVADTILPETGTPGAKAAQTGAFMALMVTDAYSERDRKVFRDGMRQVDDRCQRMHGTSFMNAGPEHRLSLLEEIDREQKTRMDERASPARSRAPAAPPAGDRPAHYFRMMKELALLGYFTSEIGYTQAMRYVETPGRFDPCVPHKSGDKSWARHA
ncbi:MAG TPA: gluconate 2-dehydrogenase subunit 3 family protein [Vicinamibacterales bacterium]|nr:gluconate 2-dehydrogenase subunit 3 family protein [Vicinamibacterales bacterium]